MRKLLFFALLFLSMNAHAVARNEYTQESTSSSKYKVFAGTYVWATDGIDVTSSSATYGVGVLKLLLILPIQVQAGLLVFHKA